MAYTDNARVPVGTRTGRVICAANRGTARQTMTAGATPAPPSLPPISDAVDEHGAYQRFEIRAGDVSSTDANKGSAAPMRAFITVEELGNVQRYGQEITQTFGLVVEPGPQVRENLFVVLAQWNAYPQDNKSWRPPPVEFGILQKGRQRIREDGKLVGVKDANGVLLRDEWLYLRTHILGPAGKVVDSGIVLSDAPLVRGAYQEVQFTARDGQGGPGWAELRLNGKRQGKPIVAPVGYSGFRSLYPAYGGYAHVGQVSPIAARFYGWEESGCRL